MLHNTFKLLNGFRFVMLCKERMPSIHSEAWPARPIPDGMQSIEWQQQSPHSSNQRPLRKDIICENTKYLRRVQVVNGDLAKRTALRVMETPKVPSGTRKNKRNWKK